MNHRDAPNLPFEIDALGPFMPERVSVTFEPSPRPTTPELEALIEAEWTRQTALAAGSDRMLFNGPLLRYVRHTVRPGAAGGAAELHLVVGPTCYRDFVGTNLFHHDRIEAFGWERFANPIGTTATLTTRDGRICYGRRSARVSYHAGHVHTFGGALEARDRGADGRVDPFASVCRELFEELSLRREEARELICVGLIRDHEIHQPEMLFEARLELTAEQLRSRWLSADARDEHDEIVSLADEPGAILPFIRSCGAIAPVAVGALFLHGRLRWGETWFEQSASVW